MKICEVVVSLVIIGVLGSDAVAQRQKAQVPIDTLRQLQYQRYIENRMRAKCERNGGPTSFDDTNFQKSADIFVSCVQTLVNVTQFEAEMAEARSQSREDSVIDEYCRRVPTFEQCMKNVTALISPCLESEERSSVGILLGVTKVLLKYACNGGRQEVVEFVAAGGSRCLASKYPAVQYCSAGAFPTPNFDAIVIPGLGMLPKLSLNVSGCKNIDDYRRCGIGVLERCDDATVARVVDGLFDVVKGETSCKQLLDDSSYVMEQEQLISGIDIELESLTQDSEKEILEIRTFEGQPGDIGEQ